MEMFFKNPKMIDTVVLDWDDTVNGTFLPLRKAVSDAGYPLPPEDVYLTTANTNGGLDIALKDGGFMRVRNTRHGDIALTLAIQQLQAMGIQVGICTHRGFHDDAAELSKDVFESLGWTPNFIYILDPAACPDKVNFLDEMYGNGSYVLCDDRPRWDDKSALPSHVWLMDQPWNRDVVVADDFCRIANLEDLARKLHIVHNQFVQPSLVYAATGLWTQTDEIRRARYYAILRRDVGDALDKLKEDLAKYDITPSEYGSLFIGDVRARPLLKTSFYGIETELLIRLLNNLHLGVINVNDDNEWVDISITDDGRFQAIRQDGLYRKRDTRTGKWAAVIRTTVLAPDPYCTAWYEDPNSVTWVSCGDVDAVQMPTGQHVSYRIGENHTTPSRDGAIAWAEACRSDMFTKLRTTITDPVTGITLPAPIYTVSVLCEQLGSGGHLATLELLWLWSTEFEHVKTWEKLLELYSVRYPTSYALIKPQVHSIPNMEYAEPVRTVHSVEIKAGVYLVNTPEGHDAVVSEWAKSRWLKPRPIPLADRTYPALVVLTQVNPTSYSTVCLAIGDLTEAVRIVGIN